MRLYSNVTIHRVKLEFRTEQAISIPYGSTVLDAGFDPNDGQLCLWVAAPVPARKLVTLTVFIGASDGPLAMSLERPIRLIYIGRVDFAGLVSHVFVEEDQSF